MSSIITRSERQDLWKEVGHQLEARHCEPKRSQRWRLKLVMKYAFDEERHISGRLAQVVDYPQGDDMHKMVGITLNTVQNYLHNFDESTWQLAQPRIKRLVERSRKATIDYGDRPRIPRRYRRAEPA
jgi:hypothetical protein